MEKQPIFWNDAAAAFILNWPLAIADRHGRSGRSPPLGERGPAPCSPRVGEGTQVWAVLSGSQPGGSAGQPAKQNENSETNLSDGEDLR